MPQPAGWLGRNVTFLGKAYAQYAIADAATWSRWEGCRWKHQQPGVDSDQTMGFSSVTSHFPLLTNLEYLRIIVNICQLSQLIVKHC